MKIIFVGLSNKIDLKPFDSTTKSGQIIDKIIDNLDDTCFKMNLVSYAPLDENNKLRYPTKKEIEKAIPDFLKQVDIINPDIIISFGNIVSYELEKLEQTKYRLIQKKHPSYVTVYKHKQINDYIDDILLSINTYKKKLL